MLSLNPKSTALVIIDLQKGILGRSVSPHSAAQVIQNTVRIGLHLQDAGGVIAPVRVAFSPDGGDRLTQPIDDTTTFGAMPPDWSELAPEIASLRANFIITKRHWGAFDGAELDLQLRRRGIETIVLTGIATNFGVESTAREARQLNYAVVIAEDAVTSIGEDMHKFSIERIMPRIARVRSTDEIIAGLSTK